MYVVPFSFALDSKEINHATFEAEDLQSFLDSGEERALIRNAGSIIGILHRSMVEEWFSERPVSKRI